MPAIQRTKTKISPTGTFGVFDIAVEGLTTQDTDLDRADLIFRLDCRGDVTTAAYVRHDAYKRVSMDYPWTFTNSYRLPITGLQEWQIKLALASELAKSIVLTAGGE